MAEIRVTGNGRATSAPDEAGFNFQCTGSGKDASSALAQATAAAESVLVLLDEVGVPADRRGVQRAHVHPRSRWVNDREVREGWDANTSVECTLADATAAFDLLDRASNLADVSINGPHWKVRPDNPAHETARRLAVDDARMKAASYASAAKMELGELMELIEGGAIQPQLGIARMAMAESSSLEPSEQSVGASITLVFYAT
jgi:uncharacterized protein YggE